MTATKIHINSACDYTIVERGDMLTKELYFALRHAADELVDDRDEGIKTDGQAHIEIKGNRMQIHTCLVPKKDFILCLRKCAKELINQD